MTDPEQFWNRNTFLFEEIRKEVEEYLLVESGNTNFTDGVSTFLATLPEKI